MNGSAAVTDCGFDLSLISRFADGETTPPERRKVLKHLLSGCSTCRAALAPKIRLFDPGGISEFSISKVLANVAEIEQQMHNERGLAAEQFREFLRHPPARQWTLLRNSNRYDSWAFCELLLDAGFDAIYDDPHRSLELCEMGILIVERLGTGPYSDSHLEDLRCRAWGRAANAMRAASNLPGAERALAKAAVHLRQGSGDPLEEAEHIYFTASLRRAERRLDEALRAIHRSRRIYRMLGDRHLEGRSLMCESTIRDLRGEIEESLACCRQARELVDPDRDRRLAIAAHHNLVWQLMCAHRPVEALAELEELRPSYNLFNDQIPLLKLRWMEARLAKDLGRAEEAERAFREAHDGFVEARIPYEAASVALDLAVLFAEAGRRQELKLLAAELVAVFRSLGVAREAFAALTMLEQLAQAEAVTVGLLLRLSRYFTEVRNQPDLRFDPDAG